METPPEKGTPNDSSGVKRSEVDRKRDELLDQARRNTEEGREPSGESGSMSALAGLGLQFVIAILLCLYAGMWLDRKLGTSPWFVVGGIVVGASAGFFVMYRVLMAENAKPKK
jgi:ATP synthase protein I